MAYVPPHRRIQEGSSSSVRPTSIAPPPYVRNNFRKWFAVDGNGDTSNLSLEFKPFHGDPPPHLQDKKLYTLFGKPPAKDGLEMENNQRSSAINEAFPWKKICERFKDDIQQNYQEVQSYIEEWKPDHVKPTFLIRLGKLLFRGYRLTCHERITVDMLEKALKAETSFRKSIRQTFNIDIQKNILEALEEKILAGLQTSEFEEKENYFIQVEDNLHPDSNRLRLVCVNNSEDGGKLRLKKIKMFPLGHFVADISSVNKLMDMRLKLITEDYSTGLSEEEKECIGGIVKSACIENGAKGGLHWPLGGNSAGNRFIVDSSWHRKVTTIIGKLWTIKLEHVNRGDIETSLGKVTHEVTLKPTNLTRCLRDQVQWDEANIMNMLEEILEWVWTECL